MVDEIKGAESEIELCLEITPTGKGRTRFKRSSSAAIGAVGLGLVVLILLCALVGPYVVGYDPNQQELDARLLPPFSHFEGASHVLGTDGPGQIPGVGGGNLIPELAGQP